jgi:hypothetical protein
MPAPARLTPPSPVAGELAGRLWLAREDSPLLRAVRPSSGLRHWPRRHLGAQRCARVMIADARGTPPSMTITDSERRMRTSTTASGTSTGGESRWQRGLARGGQRVRQRILGIVVGGPLGVLFAVLFGTRTHNGLLGNYGAPAEGALACSCWPSPQS